MIAPNHAPDATPTSVPTETLDRRSATAADASVCGRQAAPSLSSRHLAKVASGYATPSTPRSILQLLNTVIPMAAFWTAMSLSVEYNYWITLLLALPTAAFVVRLFMIQHDCGHRSFFRSPRLNDLVGNAIGIVTLTPHGYWRKAHNIHHASSGNLDQRGIGDVTVLTVHEYLSLSKGKRLLYRIYRHPITFLGIGPLYLFVVKFRLPLDLVRQHPGTLISVMGTNIALLGLLTGLAFLLGLPEALMVQVPIIFLSSLAGVWLFYVQHQFEHAYWRRDEDWNFHDAALYGSSYYDLPRPLRWLTADIGIHHIHHLSSRIPNYRLHECLTDNAELRKIGRVTLRDSLRYIRLALWDEQSNRLVRFSGISTPTDQRRRTTPNGVGMADL
jgi:omega-6 fatty acid desaturase (delta-12 desaturase)